MNQQPDKFFREKLEQFSRPVPSSAWSKVESNLNKKNNKAIWLRIAASLLLISVASYLLWPVSEASVDQLADSKNNQQTTDQAKTNSPTTNTEDSTEKPTETDPRKDANAVKGEISNPISSKKQKVSPPDGNKVRRNRSIERVAPTSVESRQEVLVAENNPSSIETSATTELQPSETISPVATERLLAEQTDGETNDERITIVMSADEVNNKYLDKKSLAEATSGDKKPSTLRKLLDKAYDLKNNEDPFGDLRQKKNEILALNFRSDKQRSENK